MEKKYLNFFWCVKMSLFGIVLSRLILACFVIYGQDRGQDDLRGIYVLWGKIVGKKRANERASKRAPL